MRLKVLSFSYCFPNPARPTWGMFVLQRLAALARQPDVDLQAVAPVPVFPVLSRIRSDLPPVTVTFEELAVHYPRYFYLPKLLKSLDGKFYGQGLRKWLHARCETRRPDVLDAHFVWPDGVGVSLLAKHFGLPYTITLRGWLYETVKHSQILGQCVSALHGAAAIVSVSNHLAETAIGLGVPRERIRVIPNGVDKLRFRPRDKQEVRDQLGLRQDVQIIVSVAHLGLRKGHREVIRALASLPRDVQLVIIGSDPAGGKNKRDLRRLVDHLGLQSRVIFAGWQPYDRVPLYYSAADLSVLASYREGCPNVVLESLASGTPVVASDVGSVSDMIENGWNGRIVPPRQVEPLAEAIRDLLDQRPPLQQVSQSSAVRSWDEVAFAVRDVLGDAAGSGRPSKNQIAFAEKKI